ncbi:MAG: 4-carboxy-4-hydroxy-2-oxoadipate aldolase/oxaloacetate decarboxylase [Chloroflexota bacterium]|nr:4-carboxy-4-hydroxy-2-oxoadipate aldolase/oxaloacetate decarboxylase [Chloroflexota bacterium]
MLKPCVIREIVRPDPRLAEALAGLGVATVHEACGQLGLMRPDIRPVVPGQRICGPAVTALCHPGDNLMLHAAIDVAQPGDVIVVGVKFPSSDGFIGELIATQCQARGIRAVILDTGARDSTELRQMGFPVWSRAISAAGTSKATPGWVNVPIVCGEALVRPGDLVVADDDGVCVVAAELAAEVVRAAETRVAREDANRQRFQAGELSLDVSNLRPLLERLGVRTYATATDAGADGVVR